jgi:iron(III) transport system permease protein
MSRLVLVAVGGLVLFLALYPLGWLAWGSFQTAPPFAAEKSALTLANYARAYADPLLARTAVNTVVFALGQMAVAIGLGTALGWVVMRTDAPGRRVFEFLILALFLIPLILAVVAWTMLLSPQIGIINRAAMAAFGLSVPPFDVYSLGGMIFVQGLYLTPLAFLIVGPAFTALDAGLEESARVSGSNQWQVFWRVTLPLARPAIYSAMILLFVVGIESFDIPQMLGASKGLYTYTSLIYYEILGRFPANYGGATALALALLFFAFVCVYVYRRLTRHAERFQTIKGKGYRPGVIALGRWRWPVSGACWVFFALTVFLPLAVLFAGSLMPYYVEFSAAMIEKLSWSNYARIGRHPTLVAGVRNSFLLAVVAGAACVFLAAVIAYIAARTTLAGRGLVEGIAMMPISFPGTVLGVALLWAYIGIPLPIYGTVLILAIAYVTRYLPIGLRTVAGGMLQVGSELEEASRVAGAAWLATFRRVMLPLLKPSLLAAWVLLFMIFFRELPMSLLLSSRGNPVVSVVMFDYYQSGEMGPLAAIAMCVLVGVIAVVVVAHRLIRPRAELAH